MVDVLKQQLAQMEVSLIDYETRVNEFQKLVETITAQIPNADPDEAIILQQKYQAIKSQIGNCQNQISLLNRRIQNLKQRGGMIGVAF